MADNGTLEILDVSAFAYATPAKVWGIGLLFVTLISLCAAIGIFLMPCLSKRTYTIVLTYFIGLGVGSLSGSAIFHLLPQAFDLVDSKTGTSHSYLQKCWTTIFGIYLFFLVDKLLKLLVEFRKARKTRFHSASLSSGCSTSRCKGCPASAHPAATLTCGTVDAKPLNGCPLTAFVVDDDDTPSLSGGVGDSAVDSNGKSPKTDADETDFKIDLACGHGHEIIKTKDGRHNVVATVAWMIIFGDGLHNFIDGLSIGAAFSVNILSGISISVAVLCEEFPHELGDVAILIAAGMSMRQALVYNLLSALTCYIGFVIGVLVGEMKNVSFYIFALAAGCFLYISLGNMISEMNKEMERSMEISLRKGCFTLCLHALGIFTGLFIMFVMAYCGTDISFT